MEYQTISLDQRLQPDLSAEANYQLVNEPNIPELIRLPFKLSANEWAELRARLNDSVTWTDDYYEAFGRRFYVPRQQAWFADPGIRYRYSDNLVPTVAWPDWLADVRKQVEQAAGLDFNSVLLTQYRDGQDEVDWHADDESELGRQPWIASLSIGAERLFCFRRKGDNKGQGNAEYALPLADGDLLLMTPDFQKEWLHRVPAQPEVIEPRINLTFRWVVPVRAASIKPAPRKAGQMKETKTRNRRLKD